MEVKRICAAYWSATGNTDKTVNTIAETLAEKLGVPLERRNFTRPSDRAEDLSFTGRDLVVFGMPTYAGKLPNKMLPYVQQQIHGNGALAVGVVTFGNRSYDNSLAELWSLRVTRAARSTTRFTLRRLAGLWTGPIPLAYSITGLPSSAAQRMTDR